MRNVEERNQKILCLLEKWYQEAGNAQIIVNEGQYKTRYGYYVEKLFSTPYRGFREVLLVVLIAMHLDENYWSRPKVGTQGKELDLLLVFDTDLKIFLWMTRDVGFAFGELCPPTPPEFF